MTVRISINDDNGDQLRALYAWLGDEQELRGRVRLLGAMPGSTELGAVTDALVVALGAGGAGTVLATSLVAWVKSRRTTAHLTIETPELRVEFDLATVDDIAPVLKQVLDAVAND